MFGSLKAWLSRRPRWQWMTVALFLLLLVGGIAAVPVLHPRMASEAEIQRRVAAFTTYLPELLPLRVDANTTWTGWEVDGKRIRYTYVLGQAPDAFTDLITPLRSVVCQNRESRWLVRAGIAFEFRYEREAGNLIKRVLIDGRDC